MKFSRLVLYFSLLLILTIGYGAFRLKSPISIAVNSFVISPGSSTELVCRDLEMVSAGNISKLECIFFTLITRKNYKFGEYAITANDSIHDIIKKFASGKVVVHFMTIAEGLTNKQIFKILETNNLLRGEINPAAYHEGEFLPETYDYVMGEKRNNILLRMNSAQKKLLNSLAIAPDGAVNLINLASIVEKEARKDSERPIVASVYSNRLKINMRLQADPTLIYDIKNGEDFSYILTGKDVKENESGYNSYKYAGLPPSAICNPGRASIIAAANPAITKYLYFVSDNNGGHNFAHNIKDHNSNVKSYRLSLNK